MAVLLNAAEQAMKRNHLIGFAVAALVLLLLAYAAYTLFEIIPATRHVLPSREARVNDYLALDRWLVKSNIPFRIESTGNLSTLYSAEEEQIFIQASLFRWSHEAAEYLAHWIDNGGNLFLVMDYYYERYDEELTMLLDEFGIEAVMMATRSDHHIDSESWSGESPGYDDSISFEVKDDDALALKDHGGHTRLVQIRRGKGTLTVTGKPVFLYFSYHGDGPGINDAPNARLAWALFIEPGASESGWLFIRGATKVHGLFGSLWREGNLPVLLVSVIVLLVIGFWTVIPMFGLIRGDDERPERLLRERFLAEGRFLKRYGALDFYRSVYLREIKRRLALRQGLASDNQIEEYLHNYEQPEKERDLLLGALRGKDLKYREFPKMINLFKTILERI